MIYITLDGVRITTNKLDIDVLLISYNCNKYLDHDAIEYLYNDKKVKYDGVTLRIGKQLKDRFKIPKEKNMNQTDRKLLMLNTKDIILIVQGSILTKKKKIKTIILLQGLLENIVKIQ